MAKHPKTREQKQALSAARLAAARKVAVDGEETTVPVWYHPQFGVRIQYATPGAWRCSGLPVVPWSEVARLDVIKRDTYTFTIIGGQALPRGFVWANRDKQVYGMSGPHWAYAPIHRRCRDCKEMFTWSAEAQQHLYEMLRVYVDTTAVRCQACARTRRAIEAARVVYAAAAAELPADTAPPYVRAAQAMLALLEAGGQVSVERAISYCTRARKLGAQVDVIDAQLRARR